MRFCIPTAPCLRGEIFLPGDKSISHRAIIVSSLSKGETKIENFLISEDTLRTLEVFKSMGVKIEEDRKQRTVGVYGKGLYGLRKPKSPLYMAGSGTTCRLLLGVLAGQNFEAKIFGDRSLSRRPMSRVTEPLRKMKAVIESKIKIQKSKREEYLPITIRGCRPLRPISYRLAIPSAQVKSAILLAGLYAEGLTQITEPIKTRDHTERMLQAFKVDIKREGVKIKIRGLKELISPREIFIPSDISSSAFFIVGASILTGSNLVIKSVGLNPTRIGLIRVLKRMGANIKIKSLKLKVKGFEPIGDIVVKASNLKGTVVEAGEIPSLIDELPILMVAACYAEGVTIIKGVGELRVKETDRINSMVSNLKRMGADIESKIKIQKLKIKEEVIVIKGRKPLKGVNLTSYGDHRTAMSLIIASLGAKGESHLDDVGCIKKSFPNFLDILFPSQHQKIG